MRFEHLRAGPGEHLVAVAVGEQAQRVAALDDREHLEPALRRDQPGDGGVAGLVRRDQALLFVGVLDRLAEADLLGEPGPLDVAHAHRAAAATQRVDQRLVEQVLDHHRGVALGHRGHLLARLVAVQLGLVCLAGEEVVDELASRGAARAVEREPTVEAARAQQGRVEVLGPVRRRDQQHVGRRRRRPAQLPVRGEQRR